MNRFNLECNKVKTEFNLSEFIDAWTDKKVSTKTKFVPLKAQWVCEEFIRSYATEAQDNMNEASNNNDLKSWRYWRYVRCSAFAVMHKNKPKKKECYEEETQRWMAAHLDSTLEIFTREYDEVRRQIAARSPHAKILRKILPEFSEAFDSLSYAAERLHLSLNKRWKARKNAQTLSK